MNIDGLDLVIAAGLTAGINVNAADLTVGPIAINALPLTGATYNWSFGRRAGFTSRYGIFPIPGHNSNEPSGTISAGSLAGYSIYGLVGAEQAQPTHTTSGFDVYSLRKYMLGCAIVQLPVGAGGKNVPVAYWISTRTNAAGNQQIDLLPSTVIIPTGQRTAVDSDFEAAVGGGTAAVSYVDGDPEAERTLRAIDRLHTTNLTQLRTVPNNMAKFIRWTTLQSSIETNMKEFVGEQNSPGVDPGAAPRDAYMNMRGSPYWNNGRTQKRNVSFDVSLSGTVGLAVAPKKWTNRGYFSTTVGDLTGTPVSNRSTASIVTSFGGVIHFSTATASVYATSGVYGAGSTHLFCRMDDQPVTVPLSVIAMVTDKPVIAAINPMLRDSTEQDSTSTAASPPPAGNDFVQWIDPTNNLWKPRAYNTVDTATGLAKYTEMWAGGQAVARQTCWQNAAPFVFGTAPANVVSNYGLLVADTVYEIAYSVYNALTGKESNVGEPAKVYIDADNTAIRIQASMNPMMYGAQSLSSMFPSFPDFFAETGASSQAAIPVNYLSYRLYYREVGSFEWLFAGEHSFSKVYFEAFGEAIYIGATTAIGPLGGQPGGFNDYSDLPVDEYIDVVGFRDCLFWLTKQLVRYSNPFGVFSYAVNNSAPCPTGEFRGFIPHFFAGQSEQTGRLVVFGSDGHYEGRFTGQLQVQQVRVSATAAPVAVPVDGSDFVLSPRGSETAFSGRCAVVAEGILYFFGPNGIFRDDGVDLPKRISQAIEPDYFDAYDKQGTGEFFAYFNKRSREILFFYRPSTVNPGLNPFAYLTKAWVYSLRTEDWSNGVIGGFTQYGYKSMIDWSQDLDVINFETVPRGAGSRTLVGVRSGASALISRAYFHDDDCDSGDYKPGNEMMVKAIERPDAETIRFVFAAGYSDTVLNNIVPGMTTLAVKASSLYGGLPILQNVDGFYLLKAVDLPGGSIDIQIPEGNIILPNIENQIFTVRQFFPIFFMGVHNVDCYIDTNYITPTGIHEAHLFRYAHILFTPMPLMQGTVYPVLETVWTSNFGASTTLSTKQLPLTRLYDAEQTSQVITDLGSKDMQAEGNGLKINFAYFQVAGRVTIDMLNLYYNKKVGGPGAYQRENA